MKIGVVRFPGTNNEHETIRALQSFDNVTPLLIDMWNENLIEEMDGVYLPGGFSYGDYLRAGAIASTTTLMEKVSLRIQEGAPVLSVCNGFQIVSERRLVDGILLPNKSTRFVCKFIHVTVPENHSYLSDLAGEVLKLPIAHFEGNLWYPSEEKLRERAIAYYSDATGKVTPESNPNGSLKNIAGLTNADGSLVGMMPHPERAVFPYHGSTDGRLIIEKFLEAVKC